MRIKVFITRNNFITLTSSYTYHIIQISPYKQKEADILKCSFRVLFSTLGTGQVFGEQIISRGQWPQEKSRYHHGGWLEHYKES